MKTKSKLREKLVELHKKYSIDWELQDEQFFDDAIQAFSEELDEIINVHKKINVDYHGREDCKSCSLMENLESAIKEMKDRLLK